MLLRATFANKGDGLKRAPMQSFPGEWPLESNPSRTGTIANNVLHLPNTSGDSVYRLKFTFAHNAPTLLLSFAGKGLQEVTDECWGIGSIEVRVGPAATPRPSLRTHNTSRH